MNLKNQDKKGKIISIILLVLWCLVIFFFSSQNGDLSTNSSGFVIKILNGFLKLFNPSIDIASYKYTTLIIRKLAHMFLYFMLYLFSYYAMHQFKISKRRGLAILFCFIYAITDEFHQLFVDSRSGQITDVLIDTFGAFLSFILLNLINLFKIRSKKSKN